MDLRSLVGIVALLAKVVNGISTHGIEIHRCIWPLAKRICVLGTNGSRLVFSLAYQTRQWRTNTAFLFHCIKELYPRSAEITDASRLFLETGYIALEK